MIELNDENYNDHIKEQGITIVKFEAPWCGPCKMMKPMLAKMESKYLDVLFCSVNGDAPECTNVLTEFGIRSVPTILFYKDKEVVHTHVGLMTESQFEEQMEKMK